MAISPPHGLPNASLELENPFGRAIWSDFRALQKSYMKSRAAEGVPRVAKRSAERPKSSQGWPENTQVQLKSGQGRPKSHQKHLVSEAWGAQNTSLELEIPSGERFGVIFVPCKNNALPGAEMHEK